MGARLMGARLGEVMFTFNSFSIPAMRSLALSKGSSDICIVCKFLPFFVLLLPVLLLLAFMAHIVLLPFRLYPLLQLQHTFVYML